MRDLNQQKCCLSVCLSGWDIVYRVTELYDLGEEKPPAHVGHLKKNRTIISSWRNTLD